MSRPDPVTFTGFMEALKTSYLIDASTGMVTVLDPNHHVLWRGVPSYTVEPPVTALVGIHFESAGDVNRDGLLDFHMVSEKGKQLLYSLP